jgi:hypothetical protein
MRAQIVRASIAAAVVTWCSSAAVYRAQQPPQVWSGIISDSKCGPSHQAMAGPGGMTDRECGFECIKALEKYVLVDDTKKVIPIANQDFAGIPLRFNHAVRITGEMTPKGILISKLELPPAHTHIGHVMTAWRDTPGSVGLLFAAMSDAKVAANHALLASKAQNDLPQMQLHAGHVLNALDPSIEPKGPGSGYGVKKAATAALQHVGFAAKSEGASANVATHAVHVSASLTDAVQWTDEAIALAQKIRAATSAADAAPLAAQLATLTNSIVNGVDANKDGQIGWQAGEGGLQQALTHMGLMSKAEGL